MVATLTPLPDPPARLALSNDQFNALMDAWMIAQKLFQQEMNDEVIPGINAVATAAFSGTSTTSLAIGTGSKSLSMQSGRAFSPGQTVIVAHDGANYMRGTVTAYDTGAGALSFTVPSGATVGSGTFTSWSIALGLSAADLANYLPLAGGTMTGLLTLAAALGLVLTPGGAPSSKVDGQVWRETGKLMVRIGSTDYEVSLIGRTQTDSNKTLTSPTVTGSIALNGSARGNKTAFTGGAVDCALGNYFTAAISANTTLAFSNVPANSYACTLKVNWTGGVITLPAGVKLLNGKALKYVSGVWHFVFSTDDGGTTWELVAGQFA